MYGPRLNLALNFTYTHTPLIYLFTNKNIHIYIHNKQMCIYTYIHLFIKKNSPLKNEAKGYKQKNIGDRGCLGRVFYFRQCGDGESLTRYHLGRDIKEMRERHTGVLKGVYFTERKSHFKT